MAVLEHDWFLQPLPENVSIGQRSWLYSAFAFRHFYSQQASAVRIGTDSGVYNGSFFDLGPQGEIEIGNYCTLVGAIICSNQRIVIHDYVFIAHEVTLADGAFAIPVTTPGTVPIGTASPGTTSKTTVPPAIEIGENAWIGARAILLAGAHIGAGSIVGAAAVVDFAVPPNSIVAGNPARIVSRIPC
jgi:acetyltransferase-like isoleucine patch superfamily enzyme